MSTTLFSSNGQIVTQSGGGPLVSPTPEDKYVYCVNKSIYYLSEMPCLTFISCECIFSCTGGIWDKITFRSNNVGYSYRAGPFLNYCPNCQDDYTGCPGPGSQCCDEYTIVFAAGAHSLAHGDGVGGCYRENYSWDSFSVLVTRIAHNYPVWAGPPMIFVTVDWTHYPTDNCSGTPDGSGSGEMSTTSATLRCENGFWWSYFISATPHGYGEFLGLGTTETGAFCPGGLLYDNGNLVFGAPECPISCEV